MNYNNIKKLYTIFIFFWVINFFFSLQFLIPNTDESYYIAPAIGFYQTNELAFHFNDNTYTFFERFPLYSLLQGIFFKIISPISSINFYSYRVLNILIFLSILILSFSIIKKLSQTNKKDLTKIIFFPILLSISPIQQYYFLSRPEYLGILFVLLGVYFCLKKKSFYPEASGLFFGLSIICHPIFLIINFYIFLYVVFLKRNLKKIMIFGIANLFPIFFLILFYYNHLPESLSQLSNQAGELPYFKTWYGLLSYSFDIFLQQDYTPVCKNVEYGCSNPFLVGMINTYYHLPILILTLITFLLIFKKYGYIKKNRENYIILFLLFSSITILIVERNHGYIISLFSFFIILIFLLIPWELNSKVKKFINLKKNYNFFSLIVLSFFLISSWNIIHFTKFKLYPKKYLDNSSFLKLKNKNFNKYKMVIITRPEIIPFFFNEFNKQYEKKNKLIQYLWFFPEGGRAMTEEERSNSITLFKNSIKKLKNEEILWIVHKKNLKNRRTDVSDNCFKFNDPLEFSKPIFFTFNEMKYIFDSNKHAAFYAKKINIANKCDKK